MVNCFTAEQKQEIKRLHNEEELTTREIGRRMGCSQRTAILVLAELGVPRRHRGVLTDSQRDMIFSLDRERNAAPAIAKKMGIPAALVRRTLKLAGVFRDGREYMQLSPELQAICAQRYANREPAEKIADDLSISTGAVLRAVERAGGEIRHRADYEQGWKLTKEQWDEVEAAYLAKEPTIDIARRFGIDQSTIYQILRRKGIETRSVADSLRRYELNESAFENTTPDSSYWVGYLMADGNVCKPKKWGSPIISAVAAETDLSQIEAFRGFLGSTHPIIRVGRKECAGVNPKYRMRAGWYHSLRIASCRLAEDLARFGVVPRKSLTAKVIGLESDRDFWRGVIDGDGTVCWLHQKYSTQACLSLVGSRNLVYQFWAFARAVIPDVRAVPRQQGNIWQWSTAGKFAGELIAALYENATAALSRKMALATQLVAWERQRASRHDAAAAEREAAVCTVPDCGRRPEAIGLCRAHYSRMRRHGSTKALRVRCDSSVV